MNEEIRALSQRMLEASKEEFATGAWWDNVTPANVTALIEGYEGEIERLTTSLTAMTQDRNLWADEHNSDCPNVAEIASLRDQLAAWREAVLYRQPHGEDWLQQDIDWKYREQLKQCKGW